LRYEPERNADHIGFRCVLSSGSARFQLDDTISTANTIILHSRSFALADGRRTDVFGSVSTRVEGSEEWLDYHEITLMMLSILALSLLALDPQAPAGWDDTSLRASQLMTDGKSVQAIALLERTVAQAPGFEAAEYELARAHQFRAGELSVERPAQDAMRRRHLEQAARSYKQIADRKGQYRQPALGWLLMVYDEDELDMPVERAAAAREYIAIDPRSVMGHAALAAALGRTGADAAAWSALDAACAAVSPDEASSLARAILMQLTDALPFATAQSQGGGVTSPVAPKELARLLDYVDRAVDRELAGNASDRGAILAKGAALTLRAQRLERDPTRRKALEAEADALLARIRAPNAGAPTPKTTATESAESTAPPTGFNEASTKADALVGRKQYKEAAAIYETFIASHPTFAPPHYLRVGALIRAGESASVEPALRASRQAIPATYESRYVGATYLEELVRKNTTIGAADATLALAEAITLLDEALTLRPNDVNALVYKALALRGQARFASDPAVATTLTAEADRLLAAAQAARQKP
jgi:tetratricopeptide (TPR) repeat protein